LASEEAKSVERDGKFRRSLFVMLVTLGLLAAGSLIYARATMQDARAARDAQERAEDQVKELLAAQVVLLRRLEDLDKQADADDKTAREEREELSQRIQALERFLLLLLAQSDDPRIRTAAAEIQTGGNPTPRPSSGSTASPRPTPRPTSTPRPTPSPSPTRRCLAHSPLTGECLVYEPNVRQG
jgi:flagellar basal body-associated protein FliL